MKYSLTSKGNLSLANITSTKLRKELKELNSLEERIKHTYDKLPAGDWYSLLELQKSPYSNRAISIYKNEGTTRLLVEEDGHTAQLLVSANVIDYIYVPEEIRNRGIAKELLSIYLHILDTETKGFYVTKHKTLPVNTQFWDKIKQTNPDRTLIIDSREYRVFAIMPVISLHKNHAYELEAAYYMAATSRDKAAEYEIWAKHYQSIGGTKELPGLLEKD